MRRLIACLLAALAALPAVAGDAPSPASRYGFAAGGFASSFIGGDSGPVTPLSDTRYSDTFGTGLMLPIRLRAAFTRSLISACEAAGVAVAAE